MRKIDYNKYCKLNKEGESVFKIKSKFYVIYGDGVPIYVGFTSRTVYQRFSEHKKEKDFSDFDEVEVKELKEDELDFDFCWNYNIVENEANEVSQKESELVKKFETQDSEFQKANGGGTVWAHIKYFVLSNKDNPKYKGMSTSNIKRLLDRDKRISGWICNFISHQRPKKEVWLNDFVGSQIPKKEAWIRSFVSHQIPWKKVWIGGFVGGQISKKEIWLKNFVIGQIPKKEIWISSFVDGQKPWKKVWLSNFVNHQKVK